MIQEYFIYDDGRCTRVQPLDYTEHFRGLKALEPDEVEISVRQFSAGLTVEFFYFANELEGIHISYMNPEKVPHE